MPKKKCATAAIENPIKHLTKVKKEVTKAVLEAPPTSVDILKDIAFLVSIAPEENLDLIVKIFEKAAFKEHGRHYVTKAETLFKKKLTVPQAKKFENIVKYLAKYEVEK